MGIVIAVGVIVFVVVGVAILSAAVVVRPKSIKVK